MTDSDMNNSEVSDIDHDRKLVKSHQKKIKKSNQAKSNFHMTPE